MTRLIDEFRQAWQGVAKPSLAFSVVFSIACLVLSTAARWVLAAMRPDVFFTPYFPTVFFVTALCGYRAGIVTAMAGGGLGIVMNFGDAPGTLFPRLVLLVIFSIVCGLMIWGIEHYRSVVA